MFRNDAFIDPGGDDNNRPTTNYTHSKRKNREKKKGSMHAERTEITTKKAALLPVRLHERNNSPKVESSEKKVGRFGRANLTQELRERNIYHR